MITLVIGFGINTIPSSAVTSGSMTIYGLYLQRDGASAVTTDRYGDAVLIESNGQYLLMDTGAKEPVKNSTEVHTSNLVKILKQIGVTKLDVYISHFHIDHTGGLEDVLANFDVGTVYLPDRSLAKEYYTPNTETTISELHDKWENIISSYDGVKIQHLLPSYRTSTDESATDTFSVGDVTAKVIGPYGDFTMAQFKSKDGVVGTQQGHYLNNYSLATVLTCGSTKFLTCGDIEEEEESKLVSKFGSSLNVDILKANHHGLSTSNKENFVSKTTPKWSFMENHGYECKASKALLAKYGYNYPVGTELKSIIIEVSENKVRIYRDSNKNYKADESPFKGWIKSGSNYQYYDSNGNIATGWISSSGNKYYMNSASGLRTTGTKTINKTKCKFSSSGVLTSPAKPSKVKIYSGKSYKRSHAVTLKWKKVTNTSYYEVYRYNKSTKKYEKIKTTKSRSYKNSKLKKGKKYTYKVRSKKNVAGTTLYGSFSKTKTVKVR